MAAAASSPDLYRTTYNTGQVPRQKVRAIATIRGFTASELESCDGVPAKPWISVHKPSDRNSSRVVLSFTEQPACNRESYELDYCYEQPEDSGVIFSQEIKPLISNVLNGEKASVIAYGARGSGKTHLIQGSEKNPGLAELTMTEILSKAKDAGKSVSISHYQIYQDHVHDLLDPNRPPVFVMEDAHGKIQLKGLSQVFVKSVSEFQKFYFNRCGSQKLSQKTAFEQHDRSHQGLMVNVSCNENLNAQSTGKMNFVDMAGYEDTRRKNCDNANRVENARINKSLYALQNVVYALNANENHVPYRESKLTRMLQDSLEGKNHILMVACLNPSLCQDTIYMVSLASRFCEGNNRNLMDSTKKTKSTLRPKAISSSKFVKSMTASTVMKKQAGSQSSLHENKLKGAELEKKGRKLFGEANDKKSLDQEAPSQEVGPAISSPKDEVSSLISHEGIEHTSTMETPLVVNYGESEPSVRNKKIQHNFSQVTSSNNSNNEASTCLDQQIGKENKIFQVISESGSPPLSVRLKELSSNLKSLCTLSPSCTKVPQENDISLNCQALADYLEPQTPVSEQPLRVNDKWNAANIGSPWEMFSIRSSGVKDSFVQEYLKLLNTGSKEDLKQLKGIGEARANHILKLREESPVPFKNLDDLKDVGLSAKQIKGMMKKVAGDLF